MIGWILLILFVPWFLTPFWVKFISQNADGSFVIVKFNMVYFSYWSIPSQTFPKGYWWTMRIWATSYKTVEEARTAFNSSQVKKPKTKFVEWL